MVFGSLGFTGAGLNAPEAVCNSMLVRSRMNRLLDCYSVELLLGDRPRPKQ
jgi:hypothetical protein